MRARCPARPFRRRRDRRGHADQPRSGLFGRGGQMLLAAIFVIACFNTCVGLISSVGQYFHELLHLPYPAVAAFFRRDEHAHLQSRPCRHHPPVHAGPERRLSDRHRAHRALVRPLRREKVCGLAAHDRLHRGAECALPCRSARFPRSRTRSRSPLSASDGCCLPPPVWCSDLCSPKQNKHKDLPLRFVNRCGRSFSVIKNCGVFGAVYFFFRSARRRL